MTLLVLIFSEVLPKTYALHQADKVALAVAPIVRIVVVVSRPFTGFVAAIVSGILRLVSQNATAGSSSIDELRGTIELQEMPQELRAMLRSVLDLSEIEVGDVMVPRGRIEAIDADLPASEIVEQVLSSIHTRIPIWRDDPDNIVGILHARAVINAVRRPSVQIGDLDLMRIAQPPIFIAPTTRLIDQLRAFRTHQVHLAIIINEFGAVDGLITLEDILEEIVGEIYDEHESPRAAVKEETNGSYRVRGWVTLRDLNRQFDWRLPDAEASTVSGLVTAVAGRIPEIAQEVRVAGFRIEIVHSTSNRVLEVRLWPPPQETYAEDD
jgi:Mg2+/Co2+ transporter CorB